MRLSRTWVFALVGLIGCSSEPAETSPPSDTLAVAPPDRNQPSSGAGTAGSNGTNGTNGTDGTTTGTTVPASTKAAPGEACASDGDCDNTRCDTASNKCKAPANDDGLMNGTETDVDCGGTNAPRCATGQGCAVHADCMSDGCGFDKKCAVARSCTAEHGGATCGKGEVGQPGAEHESCCASVPLPGANIRVDKYEITAGRMREFIARTGGNVRAWVDANRDKTAQIEDSMLQYLPESDTAPTRNITQCGFDGANCSSQNVSFGVYGHLGNTVFHPDRPCKNCGQGCYIGKQSDYAYGHPTYWFSDDDQANQFGAQKREFGRETLDEKSLNCVTQVLLAAFCAWDGGRLPTQEELGGSSGAWGNDKYPWGSTEFYETVPGAPADARQQYSWTPEPGENHFDKPAFYVSAITLADAPSSNASAADWNITNWNPFPNSPQLPAIRYAWPVLPYSAWSQTDQAYAVAAPGRMYRDYRALGAGPREGVYDLGANLMEATGAYSKCTSDEQCGPPSSTCNLALGRCQDDANHGSLPAVPWVGGSFEGHSPENRNGFHKNILTKYGKMGGRCVRPL